MSLVGRKAPSFVAGAVVKGNQIVKDFNFDDYLGKQDVVLFFYPKDFTYVCPTEILEFQAKLGEFEKRGVAVVGVSTDTPETHLAWMSTPKNKGGIEGVTYPMVADTSKTIAMNYGVLAGEYGYDEEDNMTFDGVPIALRGTFLIDKDGIVKHQVVNHFPIGRNIDDTLRTVDAMLFHREHGEVCPANWNPGADTMKESPEAVADYLSKH